MDGVDVVLLADAGFEVNGLACMVEDKELVCKLKHGDTEALRRLYEKYKDDLLAVAISLLGDSSQAEDILHDVFVSFAEAVTEFQLYGSLRGYLMRCMVNRVRDRFRAKGKGPVSLDRAGLISANSAGPERSAVDSEESQRIARALGRLPFEQEEVIVLHLQGGLKFNEIAHIRDISINTAQSRYRYGLDKLRSLLNGEAGK